MKFCVCVRVSLTENRVVRTPQDLRSHVLNAVKSVWCIVWPTLLSYHTRLPVIRLDTLIIRPSIWVRIRVRCLFRVRVKGRWKLLSDDPLSGLGSELGLGGHSFETIY